MAFSREPLSSFFSSTPSLNAKVQARYSNRRILQQIVNSVLDGSIVRGRNVIVLFGDGKFGHSPSHAPMPNGELMKVFAERVPVILGDEFCTSSVRNASKCLDIYMFECSSDKVTPFSIFPGLLRMFWGAGPEIQSKERQSLPEPVLSSIWFVVVQSAFQLHCLPRNALFESGE
jgi:hypothetical protein